MRVITYIFGIIKTANGKDIYIKKYHSNGRTIKFTLTDNPEEKLEFSGKKEFKTGTQIPNYTPLMNIRNILTYAKEAKYLKYKSLSLEEESLIEPYTIKKKRLPSMYYKYKEIKKGTHIHIIDEVHKKEIKFDYEPTPKQLKENAKSASKHIIRFGEYKGKTIEEIHNMNPQYLTFLLNLPWVWNNVKENIKTFQQYEQNRLFTTY